jgi:hypothetical protein
VIERFNFYDIYGYLLPGAVPLGVLWLPFGIINQSWPSAQLATTVFVLTFSYVIGQVLQTVATTTVPSKIKDRNGNLRAPSDLILDPDDTNLASKVKSDLATSVQAEFGIDLEVGQVSTGSDEISSKRTDAFFLCRSLLIREKIANYAEQFEGLYAMLRGLSVAFGIGAVYLAGWGAQHLRPTVLAEERLRLPSPVVSACSPVACLLPNADRFILKKHPPILGCWDSSWPLHLALGLVLA